MKTVYKYLLGRVDKQTISMPVSGRPIYVDLQDNKLYMWAEVDTEAVPSIGKTILIRGTGRPFTGEEGVYIGTIRDGMFVWHVYESRLEELLALEKI